MFPLIQSLLTYWLWLWSISPMSTSSCVNEQCAKTKQHFEHVLGLFRLTRSKSLVGVCVLLFILLVSTMNCDHLCGFSFPQLVVVIPHGFSFLLKDIRSITMPGFVWEGPKMEVPQNRWFIVENPSINGWLGGSPMSGNLHFWPLPGSLVLH